jgi:hypothetical protein
MQLEMFADSGMITWKKVTGGANIQFQNETIFLQFKLCEDTSMFHVLVSKASRILWGKLTYPEMENISSFIYCLRMIFITPGLFTTFDFDLTYDDIQRASEITFELSLVLPEAPPDWLNDDNADWAP